MLSSETDLTHVFFISIIIFLIGDGDYHVPGLSKLELI